MAITYYKRLRMEIDLPGSIAPPSLPDPLYWAPWGEPLLADHAETKYLSFRSEIDAAVFPCLGDRYGCQRLMREIRRKPGFLPAACWLIACPQGFCGTIQGVIDRGPIGAIQNVGVVPAYRGLGLGRALVNNMVVGVTDGVVPGVGDVGPPTAPVHVTPLSANEVGAALLPDHDPLKPKETVAFVAMAAL